MDARYTTIYFAICNAKENNTDKNIKFHMSDRKCLKEKKKTEKKVI